MFSVKSVHDWSGLGVIPGPFFIALAFSNVFEESYKNIFIVLKMVLTLPYVKHI